MERWVNRVAVVTGASSGIGAAVVKYLANNGLITVGLARRKERVEALRNEVKPEAAKRIHAIQCDVQNEEQIIAAFKEIESKYGSVSVVVNNAGIIRPTTLLSEGNSKDIRDVIETNIIGVAYTTREAFRSMKSNGGYGHIFLINSIQGHTVPMFKNNTYNVYAATKHAITAMTEVYRQELFDNKNIKITSISPGVVDTEIITEDVKKTLAEDIVYLKGEDVADALIYCLQTPPHVQIHELIIKPVGEKI